MSARKVYDLSVAVGKYEKDGQPRNRYETIGQMMETDAGGRFVLIKPTFNPAGVPHDPGRDIMVSLFEPKLQSDLPMEQHTQQAPATPPVPYQRPPDKGTYSPPPKYHQEPLIKKMPTQHRTEQAADGFEDEIPF